MLRLILQPSWCGHRICCSLGRALEVYLICSSDSTIHAVFTQLIGVQETALPCERFQRDVFGSRVEVMQVQEINPLGKVNRVPVELANLVDRKSSTLRLLGVSPVLAQLRSGLFLNDAGQR